MSFKTILGDTIPRSIRLSDTEVNVLRTLIQLKRGNAYRVWKTSGLKHYPTVLRTLKKLEEKRLVEELSESGVRGERIYTPTITGTLVSHVFGGEEKKILKLVEENSRLFRELRRIDKEGYWAFVAVKRIIFDVYSDRKLRSFDEVIRERIEQGLTDCALNPLEEGNPEWITEVSQVKWIRQLALKVIEREMDWFEMNTEELRKLKETLTAK